MIPINLRKKYIKRYGIWSKVTIGVGLFMFIFTYPIYAQVAAPSLFPPSAKIGDPRILPARTGYTSHNPAAEVRDATLWTGQGRFLITRSEFNNYSDNYSDAYPEVSSKHTNYDGGYYHGVRTPIKLGGDSSGFSDVTDFLQVGEGFMLSVEEIRAFSCKGKTENVGEVCQRKRGDFKSDIYRSNLGFLGENLNYGFGFGNVDISEGENKQSISTATYGLSGKSTFVGWGLCMGQDRLKSKDPRFDIEASRLFYSWGLGSYYHSENYGHHIEFGFKFHSPYQFHGSEFGFQSDYHIALEFMIYNIFIGYHYFVTSFRDRPKTSLSNPTISGVSEYYNIGEVDGYFNILGIKFPKVNSMDGFNFFDLGVRFGPIVIHYHNEKTRNAISSFTYITRRTTKKLVKNYTEGISLSIVYP